MDYSPFIIMLARQRSGTNALRSVFESHPDIFCHNEVFNLNDATSQVNPLLRETNFFNFLKTYANGDITRIYPDQHEKIFTDYLEYLRCFSSKRYIVIDVKYNTTHFLTPPYKWNVVPFLFFLIKTLGIRVLNITRKNYLRYVVSAVKAERSGILSVKARQAQPLDAKIPIEIDYLFRHLRNCDAENKQIEDYFASYPFYLPFDYNDIFTPGSETLAPAFFESFSDWLGVPNSYPGPSEYLKQSSLPLAQTIENYAEVAAALRDTEFAYCLEDEKIYAPLPVATNASRRRSNPGQNRKPSARQKRISTARSSASKKKKSRHKTTHEKHKANR